MIPLTAAAGGVLYSVYYLMNNVTWIKGIGLIENVTRLESGPHCILLGHQKYLRLVKGKQKWKMASSHYEKDVENPFTNLPMIDSSMTCRELAEGDSFKVLRRVRRREVGEHVGDFESSAIRWRIKAALVSETRSINYVIGLQYSLLNGHLSKCDISYPGELREGFKIVIMNGFLLSGALRTRALIFDGSDLSLSGHQAEGRFCEKCRSSCDFSPVQTDEIHQSSKSVLPCPFSSEQRYQQRINHF